MTLAVVMSRALLGMAAPPVRVEVQLALGLPSFTLVGLAETEVKEARERVRAALSESGFEFPHNRRVTVNLAPADLPKESGRFDLPIAIGLLAAAGVIEPARLQGLEFAGELSLAGELRPVRGALALALAARREQAKPTLVLPGVNAAEAAQVPGVCSHGARTLAEVVAALATPAQAAHGAIAALGATRAPLALPVATPVQPAAVLGTEAAARLPDLADLRGQLQARRALEIAAAGGHSLLLIGPPGTGKSMLAQRLLGLLPPMDADEALDSAALRGLLRHPGTPTVIGQRPFRAPHHSASAAALVGGGSPPQPGEISLAHGGVLFLDELPEFPRPALEALREPLETGEITLSRAARQATFPARFQLVAAMNPCPCGWRGAAGATGRICRCAPEAVARYQSRLSGPLLDRIDLWVEMPAVPAGELLRAPAAEASAPVAERVLAARNRQTARQSCPNAALKADDLIERCQPADAALRFLQAAAERLQWTGRSTHRVLRIARTVADLANSAAVEDAHMAEAVQLRRALHT
jgi:magnesium chelatase family protein